MIMNRMLLTSVALLSAECILAQSIESTDKLNHLEGGVTYYTELQTNFDGNAAWMNLLRLDGRWNITENHSIQAATIHALRRGDKLVLNDHQIFSNIDNDDLPVDVALLGYEFHSDFNDNLSFMAFGGVRNMNEDYFVSPNSSLFCNSSDGMPPTLSTNYEVANYPISALCIHADLNICKNWGVRTSFYNGVAGELRRRKCFHFKPHKDGVSNVTEVNYSTGKKYNTSIYVGNFLHYAYHDSERKNAEFTPWIVAEQDILSYQSATLTLYTQVSKCFAQNDDDQCKDYLALGLVANMKKSNYLDRAGVMYHAANFHSGVEQSVECTAIFTPNKYLSIQPSIQYINGHEVNHLAGILRLTFSL